MTKLSSLTISAKLLLGFGVMVLISIMIGLGGFRNINTINKNMESIIHVHIPSIDYLIEADRDFYQLLVAERSMIFANSKSPLFDELVKDYESNLSQAEERWEKFKSINFDRSDQETVTEMDHIATIIAQANESVSLIATALDEQTSVTQGISESSNFMAKGINSIKTSVSDSSQAAEAIAGEIGDITDAIGSISEDSSVVADNSKHLAALSEKLNDLVNQFKV